jgi:SulP family sulfate permease
LYVCHHPVPIIGIILVTGLIRLRIEFARSMQNPNHHGHKNHLIPRMDWIKNYDPAHLGNDAIAGLTVAVVLIPQAIAYSILIGLPPVHGLYAAAITPFIAALWGSLPQLATGPIAIMSLLALTTLTDLAEMGSPQYIELAFMLAGIVGFIYLLIGLFRFGFIMAFISHSAVKGFTSAAALIITSTQLPLLFGVQVPRHEYFLEVFWELAKAAPSLHPPTLIIGLATITIIMAVRRYNKHLPGALIALVITTLAVKLLGLDQHGVALVGASSSGLPSFHLPAFEFNTVSDLIGPAVVMAMVSFAETYSVSKEVSAKNHQKVDVDQEFIGQGMANLVGSFFQCFPVSGSFARTAINTSAGAKTKLSNIISSLMVVLTLFFLTPLVAAIPRAALAGLVINAVLSLFHPRQVLHLWKLNRHDGTVAVTVFVLSLLTKPDYALLIGVVMSLIFFLWKTMHPRIVRETKDPELNMFLNADTSQKPGCPQILQLRVENAIYFANAEYTMEHILEILNQQNTPVKVLLLDMQAVGFMDLTGVDELRSLQEDLTGKGIFLAFSDIHAPVKHSFERSGLSNMVEKSCLGKNCILANKARALEQLVKLIDHSYCAKTCPHSLFFECPELKAKGEAAVTNL